MRADATVDTGGTRSGWLVLRRSRCTNTYRTGPKAVHSLRAGPHRRVSCRTTTRRSRTSFGPCSPAPRARTPRRTRQIIHRAARRKVNVALRAGDVDAFVDIRGPIEDMVWDRRAGDKVGPLVRWALHQVRHDPRLPRGGPRRADRSLPATASRLDDRSSHAQPHRLAARAPRCSATRVPEPAELHQRRPRPVRGRAPRGAERACSRSSSSRSSAAATTSTASPPTPAR